MTIFDWIVKKDRDYNEGVELLIKHAGAKKAAPFIGKSPRFRMQKLVATLTRIAEMEKLKTPKVNAVEMQKNADADLIERAKQYISSLHTDLARINNDLFEVGDGNDDYSVQLREQLLNKQKPIIEMYESLYEIKESYFDKGFLSDEERAVISDVLGRLDNANAEPLPDKQASDLSEVGTLELSKQVKACKQAINRISNILEYQQPTRAETPNPMPDCPKRDELEKQLEAKKKEYAVLSEELSKRK